MNVIRKLLNEIHNLYIIKQNINSLLELLKSNMQVKTIKPIKLNYDKIPPGIINYGNTCFHNSAVQLLYRIEELRNFIIDNNIFNQYKDENFKGIIKLLNEMKYKSNNYIIVQNNPIEEKELIMERTCPLTPDLEKTFEYFNQNFKKENLEIAQKIRDILGETNLSFVEAKNNVAKTLIKNGITYFVNEHLNIINNLEYQIIDNINTNKPIEPLLQMLKYNLKDIDKFSEEDKSEAHYMILDLINKIKYLSLSYEQQDISEFLQEILKVSIIDCLEFNKWIYTKERNILCNKEPIYKFKDLDPRMFLTITKTEIMYPTTIEMTDINEIIDKNEDDLLIYYMSQDIENPIVKPEITEQILNITINNNDNRFITEIIRININPNIYDVINGLKHDNILSNVSVYKKENDDISYLYFTSTNIKLNNYVIISLNCFKNDGNKIFHSIPLADNNGFITFPNNEQKYELVGFCVHYGSSRYVGHYIAYIKYGNIWYMYNDNKIEQINDKLIWDTIYRQKEKKQLENEIDKLIENATLLLHYDQKNKEYNSIQQIINNGLEIFTAFEEIFEINKNENIEKLKPIEKIDPQSYKNEYNKIIKEYDSKVNDKYIEIMDPLKVYIKKKTDLVIEQNLLYTIDHYNNTTFEEQYYTIQSKIDEINNHTPYILLYRKEGDMSFEYMDPSQTSEMMHYLTKN